MRALFLLIFIPLLGSAQIHQNMNGDPGGKRVDSALCKIRLVDSSYYSHILMVCDTICFWDGSYSTCYGHRGRRGTIVISLVDAKCGVDDICAVLVHESLHLKIIMLGISLDPEMEEMLCYFYEEQFLRMVPGINPDLIKNAEYHRMENSR